MVQTKIIIKGAREHNLKVMFHTCGSVSEIIPDLIECGVDVLDPVRVSAAHMEPTHLATQFKGRIAFHGGVSTQTTLLYETTDRVRAAVRSTMTALGPTGYIAGPDQSLLPDVPVENVLAMYDAIREFRLG